MRAENTRGEMVESSLRTWHRNRCLTIRSLQYSKGICAENRTQPTQAQEEVAKPRVWREKQYNECGKVKERNQHRSELSILEKDGFLPLHLCRLERQQNFFLQSTLHNGVGLSSLVLSTSIPHPNYVTDTHSS